MIFIKRSVILFCLLFLLAVGIYPLDSNAKASNALSQKASLNKAKTIPFQSHIQKLSSSSFYTTPYQNVVKIK